MESELSFHSKLTAIPWRHSLPKVLRYGLLGGAGLYIVVYLAVALLRMRYPFELEWMEGATLDHVSRILAGQGIYVAPSLDFVPFIYTPLYYYLSAGAAALFGTGFFALRLVSFASSLVSFLMIGVIVGRQTREVYAGLLAAGLYAATFRVSGAWFDLARVDSTYLAFLLIAIYLLRFHSSDLAAVVAAGLISLAFLTKQTALAMALPLIIYSVLERKRNVVFLVLPLVLVVGLSTLALNAMSDGWFFYYVFDLPRNSPLYGDAFSGFWKRDIMSILPVASLVALFYFFTQNRERWKSGGLFFLFVCAGLVLGGWGGRLNSGGFNNVLMPAYAALSMIFGLGINQALGWLAQWSPSGRRFEPFVYASCILQFLLLLYNPVHELPSPQNLAANQQVIAAIEATPGEVWIPNHGFLGTLAGKKSYAHMMAIRDLVESGPRGPVRDRFVQEIKSQIEEERFTAIFAADNWAYWLPADLKELATVYSDRSKTFPGTFELHMMTGFSEGQVSAYVPAGDNVAASTPGSRK